MTCDEAQRALANRRSGALDPSASAHVSTCAPCRSAEEVFGQIDDASSEPLWEPPAGFARTMALQQPRAITATVERVPPPAARWVQWLTMSGVALVLVGLSARAIVLATPAVSPVAGSLVLEPLAMAGVCAGVTAGCCTWLLYRLRGPRATS